MNEKTLGQVFRDAYIDSNRVTVSEWEEDGAAAVIAEYERRRWRPIAEAHEDHGVCLFINIRDAGTYHAGSTLDDHWEEMAECQGWTHFAPIVLTSETAEALLAELPAAPEVENAG